MSDEAPIDVAALIAAMDAAGHVARADAYFAELPKDGALYRKPFHDPAHVVTSLGNLFTLFSALHPARGLAVVDLGCGTGWLTRIFARLGLRAYGCDASARVLAKAEAFARQHEPDLMPRLSFIHSPDGVGIPLADGAVERTVMYGAFHHVHDQAGTLRELARVLASGGRAVFIEPGPRHSGTADSQAEMRRFGVIENDVVVEDIWSLAQQAGFTRMEIALGVSEVPFVDLPQFQDYVLRYTAGHLAGPDDMAPLRRGLSANLHNVRHFVLLKDPAGADTRQAGDLAIRGEAPLGRIIILGTRPDEQGVLVRVLVENSGALVWCGANAGRGAVNIGVQLMQGETVLNRDFRRVRVHAQATPPGGTHKVSMTLPPPAEPGQWYAIDLVAEEVCWFNAPVVNARRLRQAFPAK